MGNTEPIFDAPGYEKLADVLTRAYKQAAHGKGKERHANDEPFHHQVMLTGAHRFGTGALLFQAFKKSEESQRLPHDRAIAELLGAINYLAGAVISLEDKRQPVAANDNAPPVWVDWKGGENPAGCKLVIVRSREGLHGTPEIASLLDWEHYDSLHDIVAYRVVHG